MSEKKVVSRTTAIALGILCIILLVGTVGAVIYYNNMVNDKNATYNSYVSSHSHANSDFDSLQSDYDDYTASHSHNDSDYNSLQSDYNNYTTTHSHTDSEYDSYVSSHSHADSEYDSYVSSHSHTDTEYNSLVASKVVEVGIVATDNRPFLQTPRLHVSGFVCNVGTNTAYNVRLHVVAYQSGGVVAIDTYINIDTIVGESWQPVSGDLFYDGGALTSWTITPEWT